LKGAGQLKIIRQRVPGVLLLEGERAALWLEAGGEARFVYLAYALATQLPSGATSAHILPAVLLDDWGTEVKKLELYRWIREFGLQFPRAEVFGLTPQGQPAQYFLRDLDLFGRYPTYAFTEKDAPASAGVLLQAILLPGEGIEQPEPAEPPEDVTSPLRRARLTWWRVARAADPRQTRLDFIGNSALEVE
jgi:hypothetical protein